MIRWDIRVPSFTQKAAAFMDRRITARHVDTLRQRAQRAIAARLPEDEPDTIPNWCYDVIISTALNARDDEIDRILRAHHRRDTAMKSASDMTWDGFTLFYRGRRAEVRRSHGNWLAMAYDKRNQLSSGEYFPYGLPGALNDAKQWCEDRLSGKRRRKQR